METKTHKEFDVWKHFSEWEGWTCKICDKLLESTERVLINHLETEHNLKFELEYK